MKVKLWSWALLFAIGCGGVIPEETGWRPLTGTPYVTKRHGLTFWWVGPGGKYSTPEEASDDIDRIFLEWCPIYEARWGFALSRQQREAHLQRIDIQLFSGQKVRGNGQEGHVLGIWWPWEHQIDTAMAAPYHWDAGMNRWSEGLENLIHEWSHVFQGAYHD